MMNLRHLLLGVLLLTRAQVSAEIPESRIDETFLEGLDLSELGTLDEKQLQDICKQLQQRLQGEYVIDLAELRTIGHAILPLLDGNDEAQPYAAWLRARLDYLDVATELRLMIPAPVPDQPPPPPLQPSAIVVRKMWTEQLQREPMPTKIETLVPRLKNIFTNEGIPAELVWLAEVESGFNSKALSPSGAAGLYQLMPATAKFLNLTTWPFDQRLNPEKNATAAAKYLKYLAGKFSDWRLILAAYNAGEGTVRRALEKYRAKTFDEIAIRLPAETQMYVPKVEAVIQRREGVALPDLKLPR
ncbi:MAG: lytic transglycosylase domain-containing protein [Verrucomicrobiota bacterium]